MLKKILKFFIVLVVGCSMFSCAPTKTAAYFQNSDDKAYNQPDKVYINDDDSFDYIKKGDNLYITVIVEDNQTTSFSQGGGGIMDFDLLTYKVDLDGYIRLPYLNYMKVENMTPNELIDTLESRLADYMLLPSVSVKIINHKITVLGEVGSPGEYVFNRNKVSIYQVLAHAGDIDDYGNRKKVLILRQDGNNVERKYVDLTKDNIFETNWYYVKSGDVIYVEPMFRKGFGMQTFSVTSLISLITSSYVVYSIFRENL